MPKLPMTEKPYAGQEKIVAGDRWADQVISVAENFSFRSLESMSCLALNICDDAVKDKLSLHFNSFYLFNTKTGELESNLDDQYKDTCENEIIRLPDNSVDLIICPLSYINNIGQETMMREIYRIMKYDGFCYLQAKRSGLFSLRDYKHITHYFWRHDYTSTLYTYPASFHAEQIIKPGNLISKLSPRLFSLVYRFLPFWVWVLTKRK